MPDRVTWLAVTVTRAWCPTVETYHSRRLRLLFFHFPIELPVKVAVLDAVTIPTVPSTGNPNRNRYSIATPVIRERAAPR